jgi:LPXTG-motif cell wall-anchored protein
VDPTMLGAGAIVVAVLLGTGVWLWIRKKNSTT